MGKIDTSKIRAEWKDEKDGILKAQVFLMCDDYDRALQTIVLNKRQAIQAIKGKTVIGELQTYGQSLSKKKLTKGTI